MPKIIPNVRQHIIDSARAQIIEDGFSGLSLRRVASDCNIALGTTYNYFSSKSDLVYTVMETDWNDALSDSSKKRESAESADFAVFSLYETITSFIKKYSAVIEAESKTNTSQRVLSDHHSFLLNGTKNALDKTLTDFGYSQTDSCLTLEAELLLATSLNRNANAGDVWKLTQLIFRGADAANTNS